MTLDALIFDVDGTLAETKEAHRRAFNETFAAAGLPWQWDEPFYARLLDVTGGKERIRRFIEAHGARPDLDPAAVARLHADKTTRYAALVATGQVALRPGVARLLDEAEAAGLRLAIATTTQPANVDALLRATLGPEAVARFAVIAAGDEVPAKKPAPDIYRLALDRLRLPPGRCIAVEDTLNGLRSAAGAGIPTVVTTSRYGGTEGFEDALAVIDGLGQAGEPCRVLRGPPLDGPMVTVAGLRRWLPPERGAPARR